VREGHEGESAESASALGNLTVLEIGDEAGLYCGKLFADMGADVIRVEGRGGDRFRRVGPFLGKEPHPDRGVLHVYSNTNKRSIEANLEEPADRELFLDLIDRADLVIETLPPGRLAELKLDYDSLARRNPSLVVTSITGFGQSGPWRDFRSSDIVANALGGAMFVTGETDDPPVLLAGSQALVAAGALAASSSMIALRHAGRTGRGQQVDISLEEVVASVSHITGVGRWIEDGVIPRRSGSALTASCPSGAYPCRDGSIYLMVNRPLHWKALAQWIHEETGNEEILQTEFEGPSSARLPYKELIALFVEELTSRHTVAEIFEEGQRRHIAVTRISDVDALIADPQIAARGFFEDVDPAAESGMLMPGAPFRHSLTPWKLRRRAPRVGEHEGEIRSELTDRARKKGRASRAHPFSSAQAEPNSKDVPGALAGLRVVEFGAGMAGPWIGRLMAYCGAEVIKIESLGFPDVTRLYVPPRHPELGIQTQMSPWFTDWNAGKSFVALDLEKPEAIDLCKQLVARADVVVENYSAETLSKLGLGADVLREANPDLIHLRSTGFGSTGPYRNFVSWGPNIEAHSGLASLSGFPDRPCTFSQYAYPDSLSALHGLFALLCAIAYRERTGAGQSIDLAQIEAMICGIGERVLAEQIEESGPGRLGNRSFDAAPQGCYRCAGEDRWIAISVPDDETFEGLCHVLDLPNLAKDPRFSTLSARRRHADSLDSLIEEWACSRDEYEAMATLQTGGVPAGVVQTTEDQMERDPQLAARGYLERIPHRIKGEVIANGLALGLTSTPGKTLHAGEAIGEDNERVFRELLGISRDEFGRLVESGVIETG
jgi:crotonobetainyl-CoA:carnitine CoA-transferase CaiB-like acyl-CoA transferase